MSEPNTKRGARGGHGHAEGDGSVAIGGDAGTSAERPGGRGGDARATKPNATLKGGRGGRGGVDKGMPGMDVTDDGSEHASAGHFIEGGMGGEAHQADGRGGRGGLPGGAHRLAEFLGSAHGMHLKRPYWDDGIVHYGRGGDSPDEPRYRARRLIVEMIKAERLLAKRYFTTEVWYDRSVPSEYINSRLERSGALWSVRLEGDEYVMIDP